MKSHFRVKAGGFGHDTTVFYVDKDGHETDISEAITGATISLDPGKMNKISISGILFDEIPSKVLHIFEELRLDHLEITDYRRGR